MSVLCQTGRGRGAAPPASTQPDSADRVRVPEGACLLPGLNPCDRRGDMMFCNLCDRAVPSGDQNWEWHVAGRRHRRNAERPAVHATGLTHDISDVYMCLPCLFMAAYSPEVAAEHRRMHVTRRTVEPHGKKCQSAPTPLSDESPVRSPVNPTLRELQGQLAESDAATAVALDRLTEAREALARPAVIDATAAVIAADSGPEDILRSRVQVLQAVAIEGQEDVLRREEAEYWEREARRPWVDGKCPTPDIRENPRVKRALAGSRYVHDASDLSLGAEVRRARNKPTPFGLYRTILVNGVGKYEPLGKPVEGAPSDIPITIAAIGDRPDMTLISVLIPGTSNFEDRYVPTSLILKTSSPLPTAVGLGWLAAACLSMTGRSAKAVARAIRVLPLVPEEKAKLMGDYADKWNDLVNTKDVFKHMFARRAATATFISSLLVSSAAAAGVALGVTGALSFFWASMTYNSLALGLVMDKPLLERYIRTRCVDAVCGSLMNGSCPYHLKALDHATAGYNFLTDCAGTQVGPLVGLINKSYVEGCCGIVASIVLSRMFDPEGQDDVKSFIGMVSGKRLMNTPATRQTGMQDMARIAADMSIPAVFSYLNHQEICAVKLLLSALKRIRKGHGLDLTTQRLDMLETWREALTREDSRTGMFDPCSCLGVRYYLLMFAVSMLLLRFIMNGTSACTAVVAFFAPRIVTPHGTNAGNSVLQLRTEKMVTHATLAMVPAKQTGGVDRKFLIIPLEQLLEVASVPVQPEARFPLTLSRGGTERVQLHITGDQVVRIFDSDLGSTSHANQVGKIGAALIELSLVNLQQISPLNKKSEGFLLKYSRFHDQTKDKLRTGHTLRAHRLVHDRDIGVDVYNVNFQESAKYATAEVTPHLAAGDCGSPLVINDNIVAIYVGASNTEDEKPVFCIVRPPRTAEPQGQPTELYQKYRAAAEVNIATHLVPAFAGSARLLPFAARDDKAYAQEGSGYAYVRPDTFGAAAGLAAAATKKTLKPQASALSNWETQLTKLEKLLETAMASVNITRVGRTMGGHKIPWWDLFKLHATGSKLDTRVRSMAKEQGIEVGEITNSQFVRHVSALADEPRRRFEKAFGDQCDIIDASLKEPTGLGQPVTMTKYMYQAVFAKDEPCKIEKFVEGGSRAIIAPGMVMFTVLASRAWATGETVHESLTKFGSFPVTPNQRLTTDQVLAIAAHVDRCNFGWYVGGLSRNVIQQRVDDMAEPLSLDYASWDRSLPPQILKHSSIMSYCGTKNKGTGGGSNTRIWAMNASRCQCEQAVYMVGNQLVAFREPVTLWNSGNPRTFSANCQMNHALQRAVHGEGVKTATAGDDLKIDMATSSRRREDGKYTLEEVQSWYTEYGLTVKVVDDVPQFCAIFHKRQPALDIQKLVRRACAHYTKLRNAEHADLFGTAMGNDLRDLNLPPDLLGPAAFEAAKEIHKWRHDDAIEQALINGIIKGYGADIRDRFGLPPYLTQIQSGPLVLAHGKSGNRVPMVSGNDGFNTKNKSTVTDAELDGYDQKYAMTQQARDEALRYLVSRRHELDDYEKQAIEQRHFTEDYQDNYATPDQVRFNRKNLNPEDAEWLHEERMAKAEARELQRAHPDIHDLENGLATWNEERRTMVNMRGEDVGVHGERHYSRAR